MASPFWSYVVPANDRSGHRLSQWEGHAWSAVPSPAFLPQLYKHESDPAPSSSVPVHNARTPTLNPPSNTTPLPTGSPAYLPGLQLLHEKWGQGQAEVREQQAHGNGSGENQSDLPPPPTRHTSRGRRRCLSMHKAGTWAVHPGCWGLGEAMRTDAKSRALVGVQRVFSAVPLTNYGIHNCEA